MKKTETKLLRKFMYPTWLILGILIVPAAVYALYISFFSWSGSAATPPTFIGIGNYVKAVKDERFWLALFRTFYYSGVSVIISIIVGFVFAILLNQKILGKEVFRSIVLLSMVSTPVAVALVWVIMYNPVSGIFNFFLEILGLPKQLWISDPNTVIPSISLVDAWQGIPLVTIILLAALQSLPTEPLEAAYIDGASNFQVLNKIIFPLLRPHFIAAMILRVVDSMKNFDLIYVMTGGGPGRASETLNLYTFLTGFFYFDFGYAAVLTIALFVIILVLSQVLTKRREREWTY